MDLFDSDTYFGHHFPFRAKDNAMLQAAVAAVAARSIAQTINKQGFTSGDAQHDTTFDSQRLSSTIDKQNGVDWYYKAANYYDSAITHLRLFIQRICDAESLISTPLYRQTPQPAALSVSLYNPAGPYSTARSQVNTISSQQQRADTAETAVSNSDDVEVLLSAIAIVSLYESLSGYTTEWKQ